MRSLCVVAGLACLVFQTAGTTPPAAGRKKPAALLAKGLKNTGKDLQAQEPAVPSAGPSPEDQVRGALAGSRSTLAKEEEALEKLKSSAAASVSLSGELQKQTEEFDALTQLEEQQAQNLTRLEAGLGKADQREKWLEGLVRKLLKADKFLKVKVEKQTATAKELKRENEELASNKRLLTESLMKQKGKMDTALAAASDADSRVKAAEEETASVKEDNDSLRAELKKQRDKAVKAEQMSQRAKAALVRLAKSAEEVNRQKDGYEKKLERAAAEIQKLATEVTELRQQRASEELRKSAADLASSMRSEHEHLQQHAASSASPASPASQAAPAASSPRTNAVTEPSVTEDDFSQVVNEAQALTTNIYVQLAESSGSPGDDQSPKPSATLALKKKKA